MREIEFRGKRIDNGEWVYGYVVFNKDESQAWISESKEDDWTIKSQFEVDPKTVGQYTGLKDKNETEIYEEALILAKENIYHGIVKGKVKYDIQNACYVVIDNVTGDEFTFHSLSDIEVLD